MFPGKEEISICEYREFYLKQEYLTFNPQLGLRGV